MTTLQNHQEENVIHIDGIDIVKIDGTWHAARVQSAKWNNLMQEQPMANGAHTPEQAIDQLAREENSHIEVQEKLAKKQHQEKLQDKEAHLAEVEDLLNDRKSNLKEIEAMRQQLIENPSIDLRDKKLELVDAEIANYHSDIEHLQALQTEIKLEIWTM